MSKTVHVMTKRSHFTDDQKERFMEQFLASGQSVKHFAADHGINFHTMAKWVRLHKENAKDAPESSNRSLITQLPDTLGMNQLRPTLEEVAKISNILAENEILKKENQRLQAEIDESHRVLGQSLFDLRRRKIA